MFINEVNFNPKVCKNIEYLKKMFPLMIDLDQKHEDWSMVGGQFKYIFDNSCNYLIKLYYYYEQKVFIEISCDRRENLRKAE